MVRTVNPMHRDMPRHTGIAASNCQEFVCGDDSESPGLCGQGLRDSWFLDAVEFSDSQRMDANCDIEPVPPRRRRGYGLRINRGTSSGLIRSMMPAITSRRNLPDEMDAEYARLTDLVAQVPPCAAGVIVGQQRRLVAQGCARVIFPRLTYQSR